MPEKDKNNLENTENSDNLASQIARDVMVIFQKQLDVETASKEACKYILKTANTREKASQFFDATEMWVDSGPATDKFAALSWIGLVNQSSEDVEYEKFLRVMIERILEGYYNLEKPDIEFKEKRYSSYTSVIGNTFIKMVDINPSNESTASEIYSILVHDEMVMEGESQAHEEEKGHSIIPTDMQKLYDEMIDYLADRSLFKADPMSGDEGNPNEHIEVLCERLRSTRRYVMQEVINERAAQRKKKLEMELENQLASAEEIVMVSPHFTEGVAYFVQEKRYNFKYLAIEKIRITLQLLGSIVGAIYFFLGYLEMWGMKWLDGLAVCLIMLVFVRIIGSRKQFKYFYPEDVSKELEEKCTSFLNVMRNMSHEQLENFILRQIKLEENQKYLTMVPEFMKYLYAIMPDRKSMMITVDELSELVENSEIEVAKQLRGQ